MQKHKHGGDIYSQNCKVDYSANINPLGVPKGIARAVCDSASRIQNYPDTDCRELRTALALYEQVDPGQIIFGNGAAELIFALAAGLKPKKALLAVPCFAEYAAALEAAGCTVCYFRLLEEQGFVLQENYLDAITEDLDMLFLCNPNNPTGIQIPPEFLERIVKRCRECRVLMVLDECFCGFLDEPEANTMKRLLPESEYLFILNAFTKLYAMPGLRLGYGLCGSPGVLESMQRVMQPWSVSIPAQMAGLAALKEQEYVEHARRLIQREREFLINALQELGLKIYGSSANFIFFRGPEDLYPACSKQGYLIRDCSNYRGLEPGCFRIAVRKQEENITFVKALKKILK